MVQLVCSVFRMDHMNRAIAAHISQQLITRDRSQNWLSEKTNIPRSTLKRSLTGSRPFNVEELNSIAGALDLGITDLVRPAEPQAA